MFLFATENPRFVVNKVKGRISKRVFQENKAQCVSGSKCSFFGKFGVLCFLGTPVLRFALLTYYRRITGKYFPRNKDLRET